MVSCISYEGMSYQVFATPVVGIFGRIEDLIASLVFFILLLV